MEERPDHPHLYELVASDQELSQNQGPVLVHAFEGFLDAGHTIEQFSQTIKDQHSVQLVASFDIDEMFDYRGRRPRMKLKDGKLTDVNLPKLELYAIKDKNNTPFLLLTGQEPDYKWQSFAQALEELIKRFGVKKVIGIHAIPTGVPHTRPTVINAHTDNPELAQGIERWDQDFSFSASMSTYLDYSMSQRNFDTLGLVVHVPHYLQHAEYPESTRMLLQEFSRITGINIDTREISQNAAIFKESIDDQINANAEARLLVETLEQQYDSFIEAKIQKQNLLVDAADLPTGEEIADELEKFLAGFSNSTEETGGPTNRDNETPTSVDEDLPSDKEEDSE